MDKEHMKSLCIGMVLGIAGSVVITCLVTILLDLNVIVI